MENNSQSQNTISNDDTIDIRGIFVKYMKKWYWFAGSVFVCLVIAFAYLKITLPQYSVQSSILLRDDKADNPFSQLAILNTVGGSGASKAVEDEIQILTTKTIMSKMVNSLGIETEYFEKNGFKSFTEIYPIHLSPIRLVTPEFFNDTLISTMKFDIKRTKKGYKIILETKNHRQKYFTERLPITINTPNGEVELVQMSPIEPGANFRIITYPSRILSERYSSIINVVPVNKNSNAISVSTVSQTTAKAKDVLNKLIGLYNEEVIGERNLISQNTVDFADEQIKLIEQELSEIEVEVEKYKKNHNLTDISSEAELFLRSMSEYDRKSSEIQTQINLLTYLDDYLKKEENKNSLIPANLGVEDQALKSLIQDYNETLLERMRLYRSTNEQNPVISQLENTLAALRSSIFASINSILHGLAIAQNDLRKRESQFTAKIQGIPTQEREYIELKRRQEVTQALYIFLLQRKKENEMRLATSTSSIKLLDAAYASLYPVAPKRKIILLAAFIFGLIIPIVIIYLLDLFRNKIQDKAELQQLVRVPIIGSVGQIKSLSPIVEKAGKTSPIIEMFRQIRTNLQFMIAGKEKPVILVTSSIAGEGKSFISINLALSLTLMKKKVALIGLDVRNPMLGHYFNIPQDNKGMTVFLSNPDIKLKDLIYEYPANTNLHIIKAGPVPPNPTELLMSDRLDEAIQELKLSYDCIIIDSAPLGIVPDTYQLSRVADNTVYVVRQDHTPRECAEFINETYKENKLKNMSIIFNGADMNVSYGAYGSYGKKPR
jgi:capsular exopolysaccharide synthesis family protein